MKNIKEGNVGVHVMQCCFHHGCKYGDKDCPVELGAEKQYAEWEGCDCSYEDGFGITEEWSLDW